VLLTGSGRFVTWIFISCTATVLSNSEVVVDGCGSTLISAVVVLGDGGCVVEGTPTTSVVLTNSTSLTFSVVDGFVVSSSVMVVVGVEVVDGSSVVVVVSSTVVVIGSSVVVVVSGAWVVVVVGASVVVVVVDGSSVVVVVSSTVVVIGSSVVVVVSGAWVVVFVGASVVVVVTLLSKLRKISRKRNSKFGLK
jgi:hypothetical protein